MYGFIWRRLPGRPAVRVALAMALAVVTGVLLWYLVFPALADSPLLNSATVGSMN